MWETAPSSRSHKLSQHTDLGPASARSSRRTSLIRHVQSHSKMTADSSPKLIIAIDGPAGAVIREQRRIQQRHSRGASAEAMAAELRERDRRDRTRANSPLEPAPDAVVLDSTSLSEDEVLQRVEALVEKKLAEN